MPQSNNHLVIMAGGVGSRFWPMSTSDMPKQFIDVLGVGKTLLQLTFERFEDICPAENTWVVTNKKYRDIVRRQLPGIPEKNILLEPFRRNTAPCIAYVSWHIKVTNPDANVVVTPSDHIVIDKADFKRVVNSCLKFTRETDSIVTLGIKPDHPETGYGYIQADLTTSSPRNPEIYRVDKFREKPDIETATKYIKSNNFFWNSGLFIWRVKTIVDVFRVYQPAINNAFEDIKDLLGSEKEQPIVDEIYRNLPNISVDYAIMEKAEEIFVCPSNFGWSDLGTWSSLLKQSKRDLYGNSGIGKDIKFYDSRNCIVHVLQADQVIIQGLDGYIVAEKDGRLLVCQMSEEQRIKQFIETK